MVRRTDADRARRAALADAAAGAPQAREAPVADRPQMTLRVYNVTPAGERRSLHTSTYRPDTTAPLDLNGCWPPCRCPRCRRGKS
ncbi:hypothetical protein GCM10009802_57340 [Streptomyces synnematoformans]|uniref:Uncharacterized protein n=1 Tax=Streptomyces synnematoformans TaxID=415721 RepID=A0ABN1ZMI6_9ACTN